MTLPSLLVTLPSATLSRRISGMHSTAELLTFLIDDVSAPTQYDHFLAERLVYVIQQRRAEMRKDAPEPIDTA